MDRRRKLTRRQRALRWCLALALVVGLGGLQYHYLSYWKPIREAEDEGGVGKTAWLMDVPLERGLDKDRRMLRGNEQALMAVTIYPRSFPNGWGVEHQAYLDCTPLAAFHATVHMLDTFIQDGFYWINMEFFGRVEDPAGDKVRLELLWRPETPTGLGEIQPLKTVEIPKLDWVKREGMTCFAEQVIISEAAVNGGEMQARFTLLNWAGEEIETQDYPMRWQFGISNHS